MTLCISNFKIQTSARICLQILFKSTKFRKLEFNFWFQKKNNPNPIRRSCLRTACSEYNLQIELTSYSTAGELDWFSVNLSHQTSEMLLNRFNRVPIELQFDAFSLKNFQGASKGVRFSNFWISITICKSSKFLDDHRQPGAIALNLTDAIISISLNIG